MADKLNIKKGDVFLASLNPIIGSEQSGTRPVVIVQNNKGNKYSPTVLVAPITSKIDYRISFPTHIRIRPFGKIKNHSVILLEQVRVLDKKRLKNYLGSLSMEQIELVDKALICSFDINKKGTGGSANE